MAWVKENLAVAARARAGEDPKLGKPLPVPFDEGEMAAVRKLIWGRRSIRDWTGEPVSDEIIEEILAAGNAAPIGSIKSQRPELADLVIQGRTGE
jgi:hypothetical protein